MRKYENLIVVGPTRTGSTALFRALSRADGFCPSKIKELNYFLGDDLELEEYKNNFSRLNGILLEASPKYFMYSEDVPRRISEVLPNCLVIVVLREPVSRLESIFSHILTKRSPGKFSSLDDISSRQIESIDDFLCQADIDLGCYVEGLYKNHLDNWMRYFDKESIKVFFHENMAENEFIKSIGDMVGLDCSFVEIKEENKTREIKHMWVHKYAKKINDKIEPFLNRFPFFRYLFRVFYYAINENNKSNLNKMNDKTKEYYKSKYKKDNAGLKDLLESSKVVVGDIPGWVK